VVGYILEESGGDRVRVHDHEYDDHEYDDHGHDDHGYDYAHYCSYSHKSFHYCGCVHAHSYGCGCAHVLGYDCGCGFACAHDYGYDRDDLDVYTLQLVEGRCNQQRDDSIYEQLAQQITLRAMDKLTCCSSSSVTLFVNNLEAA
jgi:hypothetical protein